MHQFSFRGFTLIELLVVIAIIGILATATIASLSMAREKAADAAIKSNLANLRSAAELFYNNNSNVYARGSGVIAAGATCPDPFVSNDAGTANARIVGNQNIYNIMHAARTASGGFCSYINNANMWGVAVVLKTDNKQAWCVDSFGRATTTRSVSAFDQPGLNGKLTTTGCQP